MDNENIIPFTSLANGNESVRDDVQPEWWKADHDATGVLNHLVSPLLPEVQAEGLFVLSEPPAQTDEESFARLATMSPLEYERVRKAEAERLGCRTSVLDAAVKGMRREREDLAGHGRAVAMPAVEPWPSPVQLGTVLSSLAATIRRHVIVSAEAADASALWIAHTWVFDRFDHSPRLAITSPTKRCGKSTLLAILGITCRRPLKADNISPSGVFRTVEAMTPLSLLLDEVDAFAKENEELRGVLNSGFERSGQVIRVVERNGEWEPVAFRTYCPVALAAIGAIPGTLADRAIPIRMSRKAVADKVTKLRELGVRAGLVDIARQLARWAQDCAAGLPTDPAIPAAVGDREGDISVSLLAIADSAGGEWPGRARLALLRLFGMQAEAEGLAETASLLLADIRDIFAGLSALQLPSVEICKRLAELDERPWPEFRNGKPITPPQLAAALRPFGIRPGTVRSGVETYKGYYKKSFEETWDRYLPDPPTSASRTQEGL